MADEQDQTVVTNQDSIKSLAGLPLRYETRGVLGQGGMGMVFHALDKTLGRDVAVKVLLSVAASDTEAHERFLREAKALAVLDHPNIVKILSWGLTENGNPYMVMELLEGTSLAAELSTGRKYSPGEFKDIFLQVLSGLSHAHAHNFIHRDIKPSNIFISRQPDGTLLVKIIDFGLARLLANAESGSAALTRTNVLLGSPAYMSPEQCKGASLTQVSDIYSLACVMYEVLTGKPPHQAETAMEVMYKHANEDTARLALTVSDLASRSLAALIDRCLSRDPLLRPQSADLLRAELVEVFNSRFDTSSFFIQSPSSKRENSRAALLIPAALLLLLLPLAISFLLRPAGNDIGSSRIVDSERIESELKTLEDELVGLERSYGTAKTDEVKTEQAERIVRKLLEKARRENSLKNYVRVEKTLNRALSYCGDTDRESQDLRARVNLEYGICKVAMKDDLSAENYFNNGVACLKIKEGEINTRASLLKHRALLHIRGGQTEKLREDLQILTDDCPSYCPAVFRILLKELKRLKPEKDSDKLALLQVYHHIGYFLLNRGAPDLLEQAIDGIHRIHPTVPPELVKKEAYLENGIRYVLEHGQK